MKSNQGIQVSVVVCTYNRVNLLARTLNSLVRQSVNKSSYEVVVVNNGSTDKTDQVITQNKNQINLVRVKETKLGLSIARNRGREIAKGSIVAFIDDDAIADPDWLKSILETFKASGKIGVVGGKTTPLWEQPIPTWFPTTFIGFLSVIDFGNELITSTEKTLIAGVNCAFRKEALDKVKHFPEELGRKGNSLNSGEESYVCYRLFQLGYSCVYQPAMKVQHFIPMSKLTRWWLTRRLFWEGASTVVIKSLLDVRYRRQMGKLWQEKWQLMRRDETERIGWNQYFAHDPVEFEKWCNFMYRVGFLYGLWHNRK